MNLDELRAAQASDEELEYHLMGMEKNADLLPGPDWYSCRVDSIAENGNVEIELTDPKAGGYYVTVLHKNLAIAFRGKEVTP